MAGSATVFRPLLLLLLLRFARPGVACLRRELSSRGGLTLPQISDLAQYRFVGAGWPEGHSPCRNIQWSSVVIIVQACCKTLLYGRAATPTLWLVPSGAWMGDALLLCVRPSECCGGMHPGVWRKTPEKADTELVGSDASIVTVLFFPAAWRLHFCVTGRPTAGTTLSLSTVAFLGMTGLRPNIEDPAQVPMETARGGNCEAEPLAQPCPSEPKRRPSGWGHRGQPKRQSRLIICSIWLCFVFPTAGGRRQ